MCWPSPISSRTPKPTCGAISNISPASPSGCSWPIQPLAPPSAPRLDPGWSGKRFSFLPWWFRLHLPSGAALASTHRTALQADAWLLGCGCGDVGPAESCGNDFLLDPHFLRLPLFAMLFDSNWSVPTAAASVVHNPGQRPPPPTLVRYDSCRVGLVMDDQTSPSFSETTQMTIIPREPFDRAQRSH